MLVSPSVLLLGLGISEQILHSGKKEALLNKAYGKESPLGVGVRGADMMDFGE